MSTRELALVKVGQQRVERLDVCPRAVGDVPLRVGQAMTYVFDFGDWWEFDVTLESVDPEMAIEKPVVLEAHGEPPEQYGW